MLTLLFLSLALVLSPGTQTITCPEPAARNQWVGFRKDVVIDSVKDPIIADIAVDSKYWLWVNGRMVIREGGLKRGPAPSSSYFDRVDLTRYVRKGANSIAVLLWYFGKSGFSHIDSGRAQLVFDCPALGVRSDSSWRCRLLPAYGTCGKPLPNYRLSESNILFDAGKDIPAWQTGPTPGFEPAVCVESTLGRLVQRPVPQWKDFGRKSVPFERRRGGIKDTVVAELPYNMQMTPYVRLSCRNAGDTVLIQTDHVNGGSAPCIRAAYVTRSGVQEYENPGWMNGEQLHLIAPKGVKISEVAYRESGYDTEFDGKFECNDDFFNRFWQKGLRTLYVNMRDTFFDCPDRERAQWWGDVTLLSAECFYCASSSTYDLIRKAILELCAFQDDEGVIRSPVPGIYKHELPSQMLASVGRYGFWNYYMNTADIATIKSVYPVVKKYLSLWALDADGLVVHRKGGWNWGDWGDNKDIVLIQSAWLYLAYESAVRMAGLCGDEEETIRYKESMARIADGFNVRCWTGSAYRHPGYKGETDDRVQALSVVSGIAGEDKFGAIFDCLKKNRHASPYMEKYVMEALCRMGHYEYALERARDRYGRMVDDKSCSTLWEGWGKGREGFGGGTVNHAWSGGPMIVIASEIFGIKPLAPGYAEFEITPVLSSLGDFAFSFTTVKGRIELSLCKKNRKIFWKFAVPYGTKAHVRLPGWDKARVYEGGRYTEVVPLNN